MKFHPIKFLAFFTIIFIINGCQQYSEGGLISKAEKQLTAQSWVLEQYLRNGNDETKELLISGFSETFAADGTFTRNYTDKDANPFSETGEWVFDEGKLQINVSGVSSIEWTDETSTVSSSDYNILKLDKEGLWYHYQNGGDEHEFHFVAN